MTIRLTTSEVYSSYVVYKNSRNFIPCSWINQNPSEIRKEVKINRFSQANDSFDSTSSKPRVGRNSITSLRYLSGRNSVCTHFPSGKSSLIDSSWLRRFGGKEMFSGLPRRQRNECLVYPPRGNLIIGALCGMESSDFSSLSMRDDST